jgi:nucleotide-binding universal stress UspA family protein
MLVPLDGSLLGERALPIATALARATGARLVLVRVAWAATLPGTDPAQAQVRAVEEAEAYLNGVVHRLAEQAIRAEIAVPYDRPAEGILAEIALRHADLVVMSTHGRSGLGRVVYGSVAEAVLVRSPAPVLLVRADGGHAPWLAEEVQPRILVPLDGSAFSEAVLSHAAALARALGATIILLRATPPPALPGGELVPVAPIVDAELLERERAEAEASLDAVADQLRAQGLQMQTIVRPGPAVAAILEESRAAGASLIAMATHGRTGLARLAFGSVAGEVLRRSELPLLLVRPAGLGETAPP